MLNTNNPFAFASSSAADPLASSDALASAPGMPQSFIWSHLLVILAAEEPNLPPPVPAPAPGSEPTPAAADPALAADDPTFAAAGPAPAASPAVAKIAPEPAPAVTAPPVVVASLAPAPALVIIAEPAPLPPPVSGLIPSPVPQDLAFDAYARLFQGIENRDLLADLHATIAPGSDWANAFGPPLG